MYLGFISYNSGDHYQWICKDWKEMYEYCKSDIGIKIPKKEPKYIESQNFFKFLKDSGSWISIQKASDYSLEQVKEFKND